jgi:hypothetical protein
MVVEKVRRERRWSLSGVTHARELNRSTRKHSKRGQQRTGPRQTGRPDAAKAKSNHHRETTVTGACSLLYSPFTNNMVEHRKIGKIGKNIAH